MPHMQYKEPYKITSLLAIVLGLCLLAAAPAPKPARQASSAGLGPARVAGDSLDAQTGLVLAPGFQLVKNNCIRCHSPQLITAKRATREGWESTIRWMQASQGLGDLGQAEAPILDYLARHYAPTREGRRPHLKSIDWYPLESKVRSKD
jgi:hypothetical protein